MANHPSGMLKKAIDIYSKRPDLGARTAKSAFTLAEVESVLGHVDEEATARKVGDIWLQRLCASLEDLDSSVNSFNMSEAMSSRLRLPRRDSRSLSTASGCCRTG
jgi:hypothetical protein